MPRLILGFTAKRRRKLAMRIELDRLEPRSTVTPVGATALGLGILPAAGQFDGMHASGGGVIR